MTVPTTDVSGVHTHVDAYVSTGSSPGELSHPYSPADAQPGRTGVTPVRFPSSFEGIVEADVPWELHGPAHAPVTVVLGGISASRHLLPTAHDPAAGWWPGFVGPGRALDPRRTRLLGIDYLAGTAQEDTAPRDLAREGGASPEHPLPGGAGPVTTTDQARALNAVLDDLDLGDVALVGASYGGMVALSFAVLFPVRTRTVVTVCAAHRTHPMATAVRWVQREVVRLGRRGRLTSEALALARALAMTTYRSAAEFDVRFDHAASVVDGRAKFPVEWYLESRGADFAARQDAQRFLRLSESIDLHDVNPARVRCPLTAVSFDTDTLVPPSLVADLVGRAGGPSRHVELSSRYGHDAFLKEGEVLASVLPRSFGPLEAGR